MDCSSFTEWSTIETHRSSYNKTDPLLVSRSWQWWSGVTRNKHLSFPLELWSADCSLSKVIKSYSWLWLENFPLVSPPSSFLSFSKRGKTFFPEMTAWFQLHGFSVFDHVLGVKAFWSYKSVHLMLLPDSLEWSWLLTFG